MQWTEERVEQLRKYWREGLSAGKISEKLEVSRNAVIGKAHRLGLEKRPSPIRPKNKTTAKVAVKAKTSKDKLSVKERIKQSSEENSNVVSLRSRSCEWPIGDPKEQDFHFCDKQTLPSKPYCYEHACIAYQNYKVETPRKLKKLA